MKTQRQKKKRKSKNNRIYRLIFLLIIGYFFNTLYQQKREMQLLQEQEAEFTQRLEVRREEISALEEQLKQSDHDEYIEKIARQQLKMIGSDELMVIDIGRE